MVLVTGGDGSTSEGDLHEALNFAALHKLPVIFLIQNNQYAISVPVAQAVAGDLAARARGYGMAAETIDGNRVLEVYGAVSRAAERARAGEGPTFLEARTYRYYAHTSDDDDRLYRSAEEVEEWRRRDPIAQLRQYLVESRLLTEADEEVVEEEASAAVAAAVAAADAAPDPTDALSLVYARPLRNLQPGRGPRGGSGRRRGEPDHGDQQGASTRSWPTIPRPWCSARTSPIPRAGCSRPRWASPTPTGRSAASTLRSPNR